MYKTNNNYLINFLFCFFPISLIIGNQAVNLNIFFLVLATLFFFSTKLLRINYNSFDKILFCFFFYIFIAFTINFFESLFLNKSLPKVIFLKTIYFYKYLFLYIALRYLLSKKKVNLILFNYTCAACTIVVLIDITIQFIFGKNITGNISLPDTRHYSGMFGDEYIAGGYIQKFSLFIFVLPIINNLKKHKRLFVQFIFFIFIIFSIILSGNRMPLFLFLISFFIFLIFNKETRKYFFKLFLFTLIFLFILFKNIPHFKTNTLNFYNNGKFLITKIFDPTLNQIPATASVWKRPYVSEFYCAKESVKLNPIFGGGIKSYRVNSGCYTHPHNYFLEIISDLGIIGLILILFFVLKIFYKIVKNYLSKDLFSENFFKKTIPIFLILIIEFFPLRTSGSFFTTGNATIIFIMFAILVSFFNKSYKKK